VVGKQAVSFQATSFEVVTNAQRKKTKVHRIHLTVNVTKVTVKIENKELC
jgi:hypothetical protein